jgi:hypothetical protein
MGSKSNESEVMKDSFLLMVELGYPPVCLPDRILSCANQNGKVSKQRTAIRWPQSDR